MPRDDAVTRLDHSCGAAPAARKVYSSKFDSSWRVFCNRRARRQLDRRARPAFCPVAAPGRHLRRHAEQQEDGKECRYNEQAEKRPAAGHPPKAGPGWPPAVYAGHLHVDALGRRNGAVRQMPEPAPAGPDDPCIFIVHDAASRRSAAEWRGDHTRPRLLPVRHKIPAHPDGRPRQTTPSGLPQNQPPPRIAFKELDPPRIQGRSFTLPPSGTLLTLISPCDTRHGALRAPPILPGELGGRRAHPGAGRIPRRLR